MAGLTSAASGVLLPLYFVTERAVSFIPAGRFSGSQLGLTQNQGDGRRPPQRVDYEPPLSRSARQACDLGLLVAFSSVSTS